MNVTPFSTKSSRYSTPIGSGKKHAKHSLPSSKKKARSSSSRYIPSRKGNDSDLQSHRASSSGSENRSPAQLGNEQYAAQQNYNKTLSKKLFDTEDVSKVRILNLKHKPSKPKTFMATEDIQSLYSQNNISHSKPQKYRHVSSVPERILDAPDLVDDYYLNVLEWSEQNILAIALAGSVYLWNADTGNIDVLLERESPDEYISSLAWLPGGAHLSVGTSTHEVQLWDVDQMKQLRSMKSHTARVSSMSWNNHILSTGGRDAKICNHDVRVREHLQSVWSAHQQEVCGLKWSPGGAQLASGGNDNTAYIWENRMDKPMHTFTDHTAAVKAIAWSPHEENLLATGAGTADRHIRFWSTRTGTCVNSIDTKSQVCSLVWNPFEKELVSSHGFSQNQLTLWKYPSMAAVTDLNGHTSRVLHTSLSPDGTTVCSAAADETIRFWKVFEPVKKNKSMKKKTGKTANMGIKIR